MEGSQSLSLTEETTPDAFNHPLTEKGPLMLAQLVVISGPDRGRTISLSEGQTLVLGRGESASAQLNDPHVSRVHCQIEVDGGMFRLLRQRQAAAARSSTGSRSPSTNSAPAR